MPTPTGAIAQFSLFEVGYLPGAPTASPLHTPAPRLLTRGTQEVKGLLLPQKKGTHLAVASISGYKWRCGPGVWTAAERPQSEAVQFTVPLRS